MHDVTQRGASQTNIVILDGNEAAIPPLSEQKLSRRRFVWPQDRASTAGWETDRAVLQALKNREGVVSRDFTLAGVETLFRLRALQLLAREPRLDLPSVVFIASGERGAALVPGLGRRIATSWPLASVVFVADGDAATALTAERLTVVAPAEAERLGYDKLLALPGAVSTASAEQGVGVHIQPMWGRCGSSTAFANELDTLIDAGLFVLRVYIDHERRFGPTARRLFSQLVPENSIDSAPHLESLASASDAGGQAVGDEFAGFHHSVATRTRSDIVDPVAAQLAQRAEAAIVNHAVNVGFAARVCPQARLVLDTHDYLTRNAVERARGAGNKKAFPDCGALRRHAALETRLWQAADVCTTVSHDEEKRVRRHNAHCLMVFPQPYVRPWSDPGRAAQWDIMLVADQHYFNVNSVAWFLEEVVSKSERLKTSRICVVGQVRRALEPLWAKKLPNVKWLGFVQDLDETRAMSRVAVCPDRGGTGISVKTLSALAAGQALVATSQAFRGLPASVAATVSVCDDAKAMAQDLIALLDDPDKLHERGENALRALKILQYAGSYAAAMEIARRENSVARKNLVEEFSKPESVASKPAEVRKGVMRLGFEKGAAAAPFLRPFWHNGERWGRWTDGETASLSFPRSWLRDAIEIEIRFIDAKYATNVALFCDGRRLTRENLSTRDRAAYVRVDEAMKQGSEDANFEFRVASEHCPKDCGFSPDDRVLGMGLRSFSIVLTQRARWKLRLKQALIGRLGRR